MTDFLNLNKDFCYDVMKVPTYSGMEHRLVNYIVLFAEKHGIKCQFDTYGNVYLIKGELGEGEFYPCMTAHLDAVQPLHKELINGGDSLTIKESVNKDGKTEIRGDGYGLGGDDKCGVFIALSTILKVDKMKASFFLEEETGCKGSSNLDKEFFDNVGYVIGFDSPDFNRSAWAVSGTQLFNKEFYQNQMKDVCDKHGRTLFYSEPFTDLKYIRSSVPIQCMNFGSGYYSAHTNNEYIVLEELDDCIGLALDLIEKLGNKRYELACSTSIYGEYVQNPKTKVYERKTNNDEDLKFLRSLGDSNYSYTTTSSYGRGYNRSFGYGDFDDYYDDSYYDDYYGNNKNNKGNKNGDDEEGTNITDEQIVLYIINKYDQRIEQIKEDVKQKCESMNIDFDSVFSSIFEEEVTF